MLYLALSSSFPLTQHWQVLQDRQLEMNDIVIMDPVLGSASNECTLRSTSSRITLDWMTSSTDEIVHARELDDKTVVVVLRETVDTCQFTCCVEKGVSMLYLVEWMFVQVFL